MRGRKREQAWRSSTAALTAADVVLMDEEPLTSTSLLVAAKRHAAEANKGHHEAIHEWPNLVLHKMLASELEESHTSRTHVFKTAK